MGDTRVVVIGLGGIGAAAAWFLARRGVDVVALEQFEPGHVRGTSHGHSAVWRRSHSTARRVRASAEALDAWREVERAAGTELVTVTGGVDLFPDDAPVDPDVLTSSLWSAGASFDWLDGAEVVARWPVFGRGELLGADVRAIHCADTAIVPPGRASAVLRQLAERHGAELRAHTPVRELRPHENGVDVVVDGDEDVEVLAADHVIVAAGAWTDRLLEPLDAAVGCVSRREQHCWLPHARLAEFEVGGLPAWTWHGHTEFAGLPVYGVADAVKCREVGGGLDVDDPDRRSHEPDTVGEARTRAFHDRLLGPLAGAPRTTTWVSTAAADGDLVCGRLSAHPRISVGLADADGWMFAPWIGRELAGLATGAAPTPTVAPFAPDRTSLRERLSG